VEQLVTLVVVERNGEEATGNTDAPIMILKYYSEFYVFYFQDVSPHKYSKLSNVYLIINVHQSTLHITRLKSLSVIFFFNWQSTV